MIGVVWWLSMLSLSRVGGRTHFSDTHVIRPISKISKSHNDSTAYMSPEPPLQVINGGHHSPATFPPAEAPSPSY